MTNRPAAPNATVAGAVAIAARRRRMRRALVRTLVSVVDVATGGFGSSRIWNITGWPFCPRVSPFGHAGELRPHSSGASVATEASAAIAVAFATSFGHPATTALGRFNRIDRYS